MSETKTKIGRPAKPKLSKQEEHYAAYVAMAEQCEQQGNWTRAAVYRHMADIVLTNWGPLAPILCKPGG